MRTPNTSHDAEIIRLDALGWEYRDIAEAVGIARSTVHKARIRLGLPPRVAGRRPNTEHDAEITRLHSEGVPYQEIADRLGLDLRQVFKVRIRLGLPLRGNTKPGKPARDAEILRLRLEGLTAHEIAETVGLAPVTVWQILKPSGAPRLVTRAIATRDAAIAALWPDRSYLVKDIAATLGMHASVVTATAKRLGLPPRPRGRVPRS